MGGRDGDKEREEDREGEERGGRARGRDDDREIEEDSEKGGKGGELGGRDGDRVKEDRQKGKMRE